MGFLFGLRLAYFCIMENIKKPAYLNLWYILFGFLMVWTVRDMWSANLQSKPISYSEFKDLVKEKKLTEILVSNEDVSGILQSPMGDFKSVRTKKIEPEMIKELDTYGVKYSKVSENTWMKTLISWVLPLVFLFFIWNFFLQRMMGRGGIQSGVMSVGKSKAKIYVETDTKVTFNDVAGAEEAENELKEIVEFLKDPKRFERLGGRMPKGVLLIGPPGTGKTLIAKAVAGEAGVPFFSTNGAEFVEMFVGVGAARVRDLFDQAKKKAPCIIFVDELDALVKARMVSGIQSNDEKEQTLNQLLAELDGFDSSAGIILLAATNRPEILDPALLRSGRFDRQVLVDRPDKVGRLAILKLHIKKTKIDENLNLEKIAAITPGFTGADLSNLVNEASLAAVRRNGDSVTENDFTVAVERMLAGLEKKNKLINDFERRVVAHHEMGHAIVASAINHGSETIHKISIIPRGIGALGYTLQRPTEDRFLMTKEELSRKMAVLLGGRAAEKIIFNHLSTGASDDLDKATDIAWAAVTRYGMAEGLGDVVYEKPTNAFLGEMPFQPKMRNYSNETANQIDRAVRDFLRIAFEAANEILRANEALLRSSAILLLEKETLNETEITQIVANIRTPELEQPRIAAIDNGRVHPEEASQESQLH